MVYEIATLNAEIGAVPKVLAGVEAWVKDAAARGTLIGCWTTDIGALNTVTLMRQFKNEADLKAERLRAVGSSDPFQSGRSILGMSFDSYEMFPWMPLLEPGKHGPFYEFRTYRIRHGARYVLSASWQEAVPERMKLSPMAAFLYTTDGAPRITHIWPYHSLDERAEIRAKAVAAGIWPPKGTGAQLFDMNNWIGTPAAFSPWS